MSELEREVSAQGHHHEYIPTQVDRELEISIVMTKLGLSFSSVRRLMDSGELCWTRRGPKKGYRIFESSVNKYKANRDATAFM